MYDSNAMPKSTARCSWLVKIQLGCHTRDQDNLKVSDWNSTFNENTNPCAYCHPLPKLPDFESKLLNNFLFSGFKFPVPCRRCCLLFIREVRWCSFIINAAALSSVYCRREDPTTVGCVWFSSWTSPRPHLLAVTVFITMLQPTSSPVIYIHLRRQRQG